MMKNIQCSVETNNLKNMMKKESIIIDLMKELIEK